MAKRQATDIKHGTPRTSSVGFDINTVSKESISNKYNTELNIVKFLVIAFSYS
jgi:hypothetical protein